MNSSSILLLFFIFTSKETMGQDPLTGLLTEGGKKLGIPNPAEEAKAKEAAAAAAASPEADKEKKKAEIPLPSKVFSYYGKTFNCLKSKVYKEFVTQFKNGSLPDPKVENDADNTWLKNITETDVETDDSAKTSVDEAMEKIKKLEKEQIATLTEGENGMPLVAQVFIRFVKYQGCEDKSLSKYKKFNELFDQEIKKALGKKKKPLLAYYLAKAEIIIEDNFSEAKPSETGTTIKP